MIHSYSGKSLNELYKEFGEGKRGFYSNWWENEKFADDHPEAGEYEILCEKKSLENLTYNEQKKKFQEGYEFPHPAVLAEALLTNYKETGEYLMKGWYSRTSVIIKKGLISDGYRVGVGSCVARGVVVNDGWDGRRYDHLGVAASRKFDKKIVPCKLDSLKSLTLRIERLESKLDKQNYVIIKVETKKGMELKYKKLNNHD